MVKLTYVGEELSKLDPRNGVFLRGVAKLCDDEFAKARAMSNPSEWKIEPTEEEANKIKKVSDKKLKYNQYEENKIEGVN